MSAMTASCAPSARRLSARQARPVVAARAQAGGNKPKSSTAKDVDAEKIVKDLQERWDKVEDKSSIAVYGVGAVTVLWLSSSLVSAINGLPVLSNARRVQLPKLMELVGLAYSTWFVYRYLLFKESREELISDVDELKKKISGDKPTV